MADFSFIKEEFAGIKEGKMSLFKGAGVAIITPFNEKLEVNYDKLEEIIEEQIAGHTDCIVIVGTTGEGSTLTMEEHTKTIKAAVDIVKHRIPVIAGTGSNCTKDAIALTQDAERDGVDGALVVTPYYNKATQKGLVAHYSAIADSTKLPIIMYNVPSRTGCNILPETAAELFRTKENIVGMKDATGNIEQGVHTMMLTDGKLEMYSGNDDQVVPLLSIGGIGVISVLSNVAPQYVHDMVYAFLDGDTKKAAEMQLGAYPLIKELFCEVNPIPVKAAMNMMGKNVGSLRAPMTELEKGHEAQLRKALEDFFGKKL